MGINEKDVFKSILKVPQLKEQLENHIQNHPSGGDSGEIDMSNYQTKVDNSLTTNSKNIVGAINETNTILKDIETNDIPQIKSKLEDIAIPNNLDLIAHRGFSISEPENTIPSYVKSYQKGFKYVECDIQVTSDGKFYLMHDNTLDRTTNGTGRMQEKTSTYINGLVVDGGNGAYKYPNLKVPTLEEFLDCCIRYNLIPVLELNPTCVFSDEHILTFYTILKNKNMLNKSMVISFTLSNVTRMRNLDKNIKLCYLADGTSGNIQSCVDNKINCIGMSEGQATLEKINLSKQNNIEVNVWIVNTLNRALGLKSFGVDYITTDLIVEVI